MKQENIHQGKSIFQVIAIVVDIHLEEICHVMDLSFRQKATAEVLVRDVKDIIRKKSFGKIAVTMKRKLVIHEIHCSLVVQKVGLLREVTRDAGLLTGRTVHREVSEKELWEKVN